MVATNGRHLLLELNCLGRATGLVGEADRQIRLCPCRGVLSPIGPFDNRPQLSFQFFKDVEKADRAAGLHRATRERAKNDHTRLCVNQLRAIPWAKPRELSRRFAASIPPTMLALSVGRSSAGIRAGGSTHRRPHVPPIPAPSLRRGVSSQGRGRIAVLARVGVRPGPGSVPYGADDRAGYASRAANLQPARSGRIGQWLWCAPCWDSIAG